MSFINTWSETQPADGDVVGVSRTDLINAKIDIRERLTRMIEIGEILLFVGATPPTGYLECDGSAVSRTTYDDLYTAIGETYGEGDGSTTFNLPDLRGLHLRGYNHGKSSPEGYYDEKSSTRIDYLNRIVKNATVVSAVDGTYYLDMDDTTDIEVGMMLSCEDDATCYYGSFYDKTIVEEIVSTTRIRINRECESNDDLGKVIFYTPGDGMRTHQDSYGVNQHAHKLDDSGLGLITELSTGYGYTSSASGSKNNWGWVIGPCDSLGNLLDDEATVANMSVMYIIKALEVWPPS